MNSRLVPRLKTTFATIIFLLAAVLAARGQNPAVQPPPQPAAAPGALQPPHEKAAIIRLSGSVDNMMRKSLERRIDIARKAGCTLIIYQMDTYGGVLTSGLEIAKLTKRLPEENIHTVAWVNDKAISCGAMIALSCEQIVMVHDGRIGDCAPIRVSNHELIIMPAAERAKFSSPILEDFSESAKLHHYDFLLLKAMVVPEVEVHEMRNATTGETRFVDTDTKNKLLATEVVAPGGAKDRPWKFISTVDDATTLLTLNAPNALRMGLSKATVDDEAQLRTALNIRGDVMVLNSTWAEDVAVEMSEWLSQDWVRFALFVAMMVLAVVEFTHPGASIPGILSAICLVLLVCGPYLTGLAQFWEIVLIVFGVIIIGVDFFIFGGIGLLAIPGFLLMAIGLVASFIPMEPGRWFPTLPGTMDALWRGLAVVVFGSLASVALIALLSKYFYMAPGFRRLQLAPATGAAGALGMPPGDHGVKDAVDLPAGDAVFAGALGLAVTDLRPAGKARFAEHLVDVVSFGSFIPRNTEVEVTSVGGNRVVVKPHLHPKSQAAQPAGGGEQA